MPVSVSHVTHDANHIRARLHDAPKIAGEWWPGHGGYHWRPRRVVVTMGRHTDDWPTCPWRVVRVTLRGRALLPGHFLNVAHYGPERLPTWLATVVDGLAGRWGA